jgi:hypothetical protein
MSVDFPLLNQYVLPECLFFIGPGKYRNITVPFI